MFVAGPLLGRSAMKALDQLIPRSEGALGQTACGEVMVNADQAASLLRLPRYWFATPFMRQRLRIPHYVFGDLVRFRADDLYRWAQLQSESADPPHAATEDDNASR